MAGADPACKLLVSGLPGDITAEELKIVFSTYGSITDVALEGHGSAYVTYKDSKAAEDAIQVLHNIYKIRQDAEHPIQVKTAPQSQSTSREDRGQDREVAWGRGGGDKSEGDTDHKLFVGGLPSDINEEELQTVFGTYGEVAKVVLLKPNVSGQRAALVFYGTKQSAEDAIKVLDQNYKIRHDAKQPILVKWARDKDDKGGGKGDKYDKRETSNAKVFAGNLPLDLTEDELKSVFETYGKLEKVILLPAKDERGRAAIILYEQRDAAETAIKLLNDVYKFRTDSEEPIQVKWGKDKDDDKGKGKGGGKDWGGSSGGGWGGRDDRGGGGWSSGGGGGSWDKDKNSRGSWDKNSSWDKSSGGGGRGGDWGGGGGGWKDGGGGWKDDRGRGGDSNSGWGGGSSGGRGGWDGGRDSGRDRRDGGSSSGWGGGGGYDRDRGGKGGDKGGKGGGKGGKDAPPSGKVFIANLPEDITEEAITFVFKTYGDVRKVHIMNQKVVRGCIAAFVEYDSTSEAETAIATLNDKYEIRPGYGPIAVRHANASGGSKGDSRSRPY